MFLARPEGSTDHFLTELHTIILHTCSWNPVANSRPLLDTCVGGP